MAEYRKFWLTNALGNKYELTDKNYNHFFNAPSGLGFVRNYSVEQLGNNELLLSQQFKLTDISGEIIFNDNSNGSKYQAYQDFIQFVKYKPLEFHYLTPNVLEDYYSEVLFVQADKSEVSAEDGLLHIPVIFHRLTEWLTAKDFVITLRNEVEGEGKHYELVRPYHYAGTTLSNTPIFNNGTDDVGFIITIDGGTNGIVNPQWSLTQASKQYGVCKINGTYDYIRVDSIETEEQIYLERDGSVISNPKQYQDLSIGNGEEYITFLKFRVGETTFTFTCGNIDTFDGTINISYKNSFVSV